MIFFPYFKKNATRANVVPNDFFMNDLVFFLSKFVLIWTRCLKKCHQIVPKFFIITLCS